MTNKTEKGVWVVWTNTYLTEGRGQRYPLAVCELKATAIRLGKGKYVQGSDCPVSEVNALHWNDMWYVPGRIIRPTTEDEKKQKQNDLQKKAEAKALELGLTTEEIMYIKKI